MLYINDEKIDLLLAERYTGPDPLMQFLKGKIAEIKSGPEHIRFKYRDGVLKRNKLKGLIEGKKTMVSWTDQVSSNRGTEKWTYAVSQIKRPNGVFRYQPLHFLFTRDLWLNRDADLDRILFLTCASNRVLSGLLVVEDVEREAKGRLLPNLDKDEFRLAVLRKPLDDVYLLASALHISNARAMSEFVLREAVLKKADQLVTDGKFSFPKLVSLTKKVSTMEERAIIQTAIDHKLIGYANHDYGFLDERGEIIEVFLTVPTNRLNNREEILISFVLEEQPTLFDRIKKELGAMTRMQSKDIRIPEGDKNLAPASTHPVPPVEDVDLVGDSVAGNDTDIEEKDGGQIRDELIGAIGLYARSNGRLPFDETDKPKIKETAAILGIDPVAAPRRSYLNVYEDIQKHFELK